MKRILIIGVLLLAAVYYLLCTDYSKEHEWIIYGGDIITMEEERPTVEGIYVKNGFIVATGNKKELLAMSSGQADELDLKGHTLMPGFIDIHTHPMLSAFLLNMADLSGFTHKTPKEVWTALEQYVDQAAVGEWVICKGLDPILTKGLTAPHIRLLDSIAPENPILIISQSLHSFWANTKAFEAVQIDKNTPDPSESSYYEKDDAGELTGFFAEQEALKPFSEQITRMYGVEQLMDDAVQTLKDYARMGNTSIAALGLTSPDRNSLVLYEHLSAETANPLYKIFQWIGKLPQRIPLVRHFVYIRHDAAHLLPESPDNGDDFYKIVGIKHWYDGSPYTGSMYLKAPYMDSPLTREGFHIPTGHRGKALINADDFGTFLQQYQDKGWQIAIHSQGDQAIEEITGAFEKLNQQSATSGFRHRLEHCLLLPESTIPRLKALNITPSFHINHLYYYGEALQQSILGEERTDQILPVRSVLSKNIPFSLHADQPMYESDPLSLISTSINRQTSSGDTINMAQAIPVMDALKAVTIHAAWQLKMEEKIGSIRPGKYADFVILDKNPLRIEPAQIRDIRVLQTIRAGLTIYKE